jgi:sugar lactone lactonase YvrE
MSFSLAPVVLAASLVAQSPQPAPPAAASGPPATVDFALPDARGLIEGIAFRPKTGAYYFGDVHLRCVWLRTPDGRVTRFSAPDDRLLGVFRVAVDEARGALWVSMGALEQMDGFAAKHKGAGGLAELDLATGAVRRIVMAPDDGAPHLLGDFVQIADGTVYATDTTSPVIWTLAMGSSALVPLVTDGFKSLQGITLDADARGLFVTDYRVGVFHVDLATRAVRPLAVPAGADLRGLDTLLRTPDGALVAIFNATSRQRILRLALDDAAAAITAVDVLAADPAMADATLGTLVGGDLVFIGDGGWNRFEPGKVDASPRPVPVLKVPWAAPRR